MAKREPSTRSDFDGRQVWETETYFVGTLAGYPKLKQVVRVGCPDPQGPFNLASSIVGTDLFLAVIECPDLVHQLLGFLTEVYVAFIRHHKEIAGEPTGVGYTFSYRYKGSARIVDDSAVMLSEAMYREFCVPYNAQISQALDGALGHFCGQGDLLFEAFASTPGIYAINFGTLKCKTWQHAMKWLPGTRSVGGGGRPRWAGVVL